MTDMPVRTTQLSDPVAALLAGDYARTGDKTHLLRIIETTPCPADVTAFLINVNDPTVDTALLLAAHRDHTLTLTSSQSGALEARLSVHADRLQAALDVLNARDWEDADSVNEEAAVEIPLNAARAALTAAAAAPAQPRWRLSRGAAISHAPTGRGLHA